MNDLFSFLDFAMDVVCMLPPMNEVDAVMFAPEHAILIFFGAISLLSFALIMSSMKEELGGNVWITAVAVVCVLGLGFVAIDRKMVVAIFTTLYPPMVIALRFLEGAVVGNVVRWWHAVLLLGVVVGVYSVLEFFPKETVSLVVVGWAILGALLAAFLWTRSISDVEPFRNPLSLLGVFAVFVSTLLYVSTAPLDRMIYQWALPVGIVAGIVGTRLLKPDASSPMSQE